MAIRSQFQDPEEIDENPGKAPSQRLLHVVPDYQKPVAGLLIAQRIGLANIRGECRHFDERLTRILQLSQKSALPVIDAASGNDSAPTAEMHIGTMPSASGVRWRRVKQSPEGVWTPA